LGRGRYPHTATGCFILLRAPTTFNGSSQPLHVLAKLLTVWTVLLLQKPAILDVRGVLTILDHSNLRNSHHSTSVWHQFNGKFFQILLYQYCLVFLSAFFSLFSVSPSPGFPLIFVPSYPYQKKKKRPNAIARPSSLAIPITPYHSILAGAPRFRTLHKRHRPVQAAFGNLRTASNRRTASNCRTVHQEIPKHCQPVLRSLLVP
jgi:hypothetical protein